MDIDITKSRYKRHGKCNRCGVCCLDEECEYLSFDEHGKAICKIFNSPDRPLKCKLFPELPPIVFKECSYYFTDKWENNKIIKAGDKL